MVGNNYYGHIVGNARVYINVKSGSQNIQTPQQGPVKTIDTFFVRCVTKPIKTNPLHGMKKQDCYTKKHVKQYRKGITYNF